MESTLTHENQVWVRINVIGKLLRILCKTLTVRLLISCRRMMIDGRLADALDRPSFWITVKDTETRTIQRLISAKLLDKITHMFTYLSSSI
jgi:hypothetical protein